MLCPRGQSLHPVTEGWQIMADEEKEQKKGGWFKTLIGTIGGLLSGACVMYVTPFVNQAVKPTKPVANFRVDVDGLTVHFQNISTGAHQGWWDFGDGSPMLPLSSDMTTVSHAYPRHGDYTAKLSITNLVGDENDRSVPVHLDEPTNTEPPKIVSLEAIPLSPGSYAPASFRLLSQVKNAQVCVWDMGEDRPLEIVTQEDGLSHVVTFPRAGGYVIKLAAVNGTLHAEKTEIVTVMEPPRNAVTAILTVTDSGTRSAPLKQDRKFQYVFPADSKDSTSSFDRVLHAHPGYTIKNVHLQGPSGKELSLDAQTELDLEATSLGLKSARNLHLALDKDRYAVHLTGELVRGSATDPLVNLVLPATLVMHREERASHQPVAVAAAVPLPAPGSASTEVMHLPPVPTDWVKTQRALRLEVRLGDRTIWQDSKLPSTTLVSPDGQHSYLLTVTEVGDQVRIDLRDKPPTPIRPSTE
jgi:PKD repeat protein